jgi:hypothetical protein
MRPLPLILIVALGCGQAPQLRLVDVGSDEFVNPMPFALKIDNGSAPIQIDGIEGECRTVMVVSPDPNAKLPDSTMQVGLTAGMDKTLPAGDTIRLAGLTEVWGVIGWDLPAECPPLLGFFEARFTLKRHGVEIFTTPTYAFVMQSREGVFEEIVAEAHHDPEDARNLLKVIDGMQGKLSAGVMELRVLLQAALTPAA